MTGEKLSSPISGCVTPSHRSKVDAIKSELQVTDSWIVREGIKLVIKKYDPILAAKLKKELSNLVFPEKEEEEV
jgi:hypothetical protein